MYTALWNVVQYVFKLATDGQFLVLLQEVWNEAVKDVTAESAKTTPDAASKLYDYVMEFITDPIFLALLGQLYNETQKVLAENAVQNVVPPSEQPPTATNQPIPAQAAPIAQAATAAPTATAQPANATQTPNLANLPARVRQAIVDEQKRKGQQQK